MGTHCTFHRRKQFQKYLNLIFLQYICVMHPIFTTAELDELFKSIQERVNYSSAFIFCKTLQKLKTWFLDVMCLAEDCNSLLYFMSQSIFGTLKYSLHQYLRLKIAIVPKLTCMQARHSCLTMARLFKVTKNSGFPAYNFDQMS